MSDFTLHYFLSTLNVIEPTGMQYLGYSSPKLKRNEDSLQAILREMEERLPSENKHKQSSLKEKLDRFYFLDRASKVRDGQIGVSRGPYRTDKKFIMKDYLEFLTDTILINVNKKDMKSTNFIENYKIDIEKI